jgi:hypothetical protein
MKKRGDRVGNLPFELTQISKPARSYLKLLAAGLLRYQKNWPAQGPEAFPPERGNGDGFHEEAPGQGRG